jgi:hypothetical protein
MRAPRRNFAWLLLAALASCDSGRPPAASDVVPGDPTQPTNQPPAPRLEEHLEECATAKAGIDAFAKLGQEMLAMDADEFFVAPARESTRKPMTLSAINKGTGAVRKVADFKDSAAWTVLVFDQLFVSLTQSGAGHGIDDGVGGTYRIAKAGSGGGGGAEPLRILPFGYVKVSDGDQVYGNDVREEQTQDATTADRMFRARAADLIALTSPADDNAAILDKQPLSYHKEPFLAVPGVLFVRTTKGPGGPYLVYPEEPWGEANSPVSPSSVEHAAITKEALYFLEAESGAGGLGATTTIRRRVHKASADDEAAALHRSRRINGPIATDGVHVYFVETTTTASGRTDLLRRVLVAGGTPTTIDEQNTAITVWRTDQSCIFAFSGRAIIALKK